MIIDTLTAAAENELYPPVIRQALQAVLQQQPHALPPGKYTVESDNVFFTVVEGHTRPLSEQRPEYHRQYLDIHIVLKGEEIIGAGIKGCRSLKMVPSTRRRISVSVRLSTAKR